MNSHEFYELFDAAESLLTRLECFGQADHDNAGHEIERLMLALNQVRGQVPGIHDTTQDAMLDAEAGLPEFMRNVKPRAAADLVAELSNVAPLDVKQALPKLTRKLNLQLVDRDQAGAILMSVEDVQHIHQRCTGQACDANKAQQILTQLINEHDGHKALNRHCETICQQMNMDPNLGILGDLARF